MQGKTKCYYVQDLERFFDSEFSTDQLVQAVEEMTVFAGKGADKENSVEADPKTVALGVLAAYKIRELYDGSYYHPDIPVTNYYEQENLRNQSYKIGMEIVDGKYDSMDQAIAAYEKNI